MTISARSSVPGIDTYWVAELPAQIQLVLAVRLLAMAEELDPEQQHVAINRVKDPHGEVVSEVRGEFSIGGETSQPEWLTGIMLATVVQLEATEEGTYTLEHVVDDATASLPIHVVHGQPPG